MYFGLKKVVSYWCLITRACFGSEGGLVSSKLNGGGLVSTWLE